VPNESASHTHALKYEPLSMTHAAIVLVALPQISCTARVAFAGAAT